MLFGIFALASFLAMNLYTSTSYPGYGQEACNNCHNQPILAKNVDVSFALGDWAASEAAFANNGLYATDEVPIIQTNNATSEQNIEFVRTQFMKNSTDFMAMFEIPDATHTNATSATSDKFAVLFNIDEANFTIGDFFSYYNRSDSSLDTRLSGQMGFKNDGEADMWYVDTATTGFNTTGKAQDEYISTNYNSDGASHQDVYYALWYGVLAVHGSVEWGYRIWFVRSLTTNDPNDVQFNQDGNGIYYAIAAWDHSEYEYHHSSFDQMLIVGDHINVSVSTTLATTTATKTETKQNTVTVTNTSTSGTTSSFTAVFVLAALAVSIPLISRMRHKKT